MNSQYHQQWMCSSDEALVWMPHVCGILIEIYLLVAALLRWAVHRVSLVVRLDDLHVARQAILSEVHRSPYVPVFPPLVQALP